MKSETELKHIFKILIKHKFVLQFQTGNQNILLKYK